MVMRAVLSFFSVLAFGAMTSALLIALMPWLGSHAPEGVKSMTNDLQFNSLTLGMVLGLTLGTLGRYNWTDVPRRVVTWFLVRERQFFYYSLIAICGAVLLYY